MKTFYVRRKPNPSVIKSGNPLPDFDRTRTVTIFIATVKDMDYTCLHCDCYFFIRHKLLCRHIYAVTQNEPNHQHVFPECLKAYPLHMGRCSKFTKMCIELSSLFIENGCLLLSDKMDKVCENINAMSQQPLDWFIEAKENCIDANQTFDFSGTDDSDEDIVISQLDKNKNRSQKKKQDVYSHYLKDYKEICNLVKHDNDDVQKIMNDGFTEMRRKLLNLRVQSSQIVSQKGLNSFPSNTTVSYLKRKKPGGSPSK